MMKTLLILLAVTSLISCGKKEMGSNSSASQVDEDMGRLGISERQAVELWGEGKDFSELVPPAEKSLMFRKGGFYIGVQFWNDKIASIKVSKGMGLTDDQFTEDELSSLCKKLGGSGDWSVSKYKITKEKSEVLVFPLASRLLEIKTKAFHEASEKAKKKTKADAIDAL